jgi:hypothetical protein
MSLPTMLQWWAAFFTHPWQLQCILYLTRLRWCFGKVKPHQWASPTRLDKNLDDSLWLGISLTPKVKRVGNYGFPETSRGQQGELLCQGCNKRWTAVTQRAQATPPRSPLRTDGPQRARSQWISSSDRSATSPSQWNHPEEIKAASQLGFV